MKATGGCLVMVGGVAVAVSTPLHVARKPTPIPLQATGLSVRTGPQMSAWNRRMSPTCASTKIYPSADWLQPSWTGMYVSYTCMHAFHFTPSYPLPPHLLISVGRLALG